MNIKIFLADDHDVVRDGIKAIIDKMTDEIEVIGEASNGKEVLSAAKKYPSDVFVLDISMPLLNGLETTERLMKMNSDNKIIIFSVHDERYIIEKALKCGAKGFIVKERATEEVINAVKEVYVGNYFLSPSVSKYIVQGYVCGGGVGREKNEKVVNLTKREREILQLISEGYSNKEISSNLFLSCYTVRAHRNNIMQKLDIHNQADLIRYALKEGISHL
jgi:DNA-binding NarL/FixJ family response regulator